MKKISVMESPMRNGDHPSDPLRILHINDEHVGVFSRIEMIILGAKLIIYSFFPSKYHQKVVRNIRNNKSLF